MAFDPVRKCFYIFDLGAAAAKEVDVVADRLHSNRPRISLTDRSPVRNLYYSSSEALAGRLLNWTCDLQSAIFLTAHLGGLELPWDQAAEEGDRQAAICMRMELFRDPGPWVASQELPSALAELFKIALSAAAEPSQCPPLDFAAWAAKLKAQVI